MRTLSKILVAGLLLISAISIVSAQSLMITYDEVVTGSLDDNNYEQIYTFEGQAGDTITISMQSEGDDVRLDSFVFLRDAQGNDLTFDDDAGGNLNSFVGPYTLPDDGVYTVVATRFSQEQGTSSGDYTLVVNLEDVQSIVIGEAVSVSFETLNAFEFYNFTAEVDAVYYINLRLVEGETNAEISIRNQQNQFINTIGIDPNNPENFLLVRLAAGETVTVFVRNYGYYNEDGITDATSVTLEFSVESVAADDLQLELGQASNITGQLNASGRAAFYQFSANAGQTIQIESNQEQSDQMLAETAHYEVYLLTPSGTTSYYGGTAYMQNNMIVMPQILTQSGDYILVVNRGFQIDEDGMQVVADVDYDMALTLTETRELEAGVIVEGTLTPQMQGQEIAYIYNGNADEAITITVESINSDYGISFSMELSAQGMMTDEFNSFYVNFNSSTVGRMSYDVTLPSDGTYIVRFYNGNYDPQSEVGQYSILIESN
ncbi:MAG: PPC domain-containing protein [Phototrophicaceae bacterium]